MEELGKKEENVGEKMLDQKILEQFVKCCTKND
jgi:hypothetical protein